MSCEAFCWSPESERKNCAVPERAMVPRLEIASSRVIPMPLSRMVTVPAFGSPSIVICSSVSSERSAGSAIAAKRSRSLASDALEMSSEENLLVAIQGVDHELQ